MAISFQESAASHPNDAELEDYCERWILTPDQVDDECFRAFEHHFLICDSCARRAQDWEIEFQKRVEWNKAPRTYTAGENHPY